MADVASLRNKIFEKFNSIFALNMKLTVLICSLCCCEPINSFKITFNLIKQLNLSFYES